MSRCEIIDSLKEHLLFEAVNTINKGGIVAVPTETYYGLAVDYENEAAIKKIFTLKKRAAEKPVLLLVSKVNQLSSLVSSIPDFYYPLIEEFWPGPLTLVFPAREDVSKLLTANTETIGVRQTPHQHARELINKLGKPITATSANISGQPAARTPAEVREMFGDQVDMIIESKSGGELPSTVIKQLGKRFCIERQGVVDMTDRLPLCE